MGIDILGIDIMGVDILGIDILALPHCDDSLGSEKEFCACSIYTAVCIFVI